MADPLRCAADSAARGEPLIGTASRVQRWLVVEQWGSWGRDALAESKMPSAVAAPLAEAARRMVDESVKRLPVVDNSGRLVGIVSRADLIESFLRPDVAIAEAVRTMIDSRVLLTEYGTVEVHVDEGVVTLTGELDRKSSVVIAERLTRSADGVVDVKNEIEYKRDDSNSMK